MGKFILNRIIQVVPVVFGVIIISFVLIIILPGDPVLSMVGERYDEQTVEKMRERLQIDKPLVFRAVTFVKNIFSGDLGYSFVTGRPVLNEILDKFPNTFILALGAMSCAIVLGVLLGLFSSGIST